MSAALFDAPELEGQGTLFGGLTMTADELAALAAGERQDSTARQRELWIDRANEARAHRRSCERCLARGRCATSRKLETDARLAGDLFGAMMRGEI